MRIFEYRPSMTHVKALLMVDDVGDRRNDELRQPIVRAQRRGQRGVPRAAGDRAAAPRLRVRPCGQRRGHARRLGRSFLVRKTRRPGLLDPRTSAVPGLCGDARASGGIGVIWDCRADEATVVSRGVASDVRLVAGADPVARWHSRCPGRGRRPVVKAHHRLASVSFSHRRCREERPTSSKSRRPLQRDR